MIEINDKEFQEKVLKKSLKTPMVVDFWASWCMPCQILGPILERMEKEYRNKFILAKVNIETNKELAEKYEIMSIPSVKMFRDGRIVAEFSGALAEEIVKEWLDRNL